MQLQQQLASALQQNIELQQKLLQNQQEMISVHHRSTENSDGISSPGNGSPDSLPPTPTGNGDAYLFKDRPRIISGAPLRVPVRTITPLPTTSVGKDVEPPLPPRQHVLPVKPNNLRVVPGKTFFLHGLLVLKFFLLFSVDFQYYVAHLFKALCEINLDTSSRENLRLM